MRGLPPSLSRTCCQAIALATEKNLKPPGAGEEVADVRKGHQPKALADKEADNALTERLLVHVGQLHQDPRRKEFRKSENLLGELRGLTDEQAKSLNKEMVQLHMDVLEASPTEKVEAALFLNGKRDVALAYRLARLGSENMAIQDPKQHAKVEMEINNVIFLYRDSIIAGSKSPDSHIQVKALAIRELERAGDGVAAREIRQALPPGVQKQVREFIAFLEKGPPIA